MLNADVLQQLRQLKADIKANKKVYPGTVKATQGRFGFVTLDDGRDIYLPQEQMQRVLPGDRVDVTLQEDADGKTFAEVDALKQASLTTFVGRYLVKGNGHFVVADVPGLNRWLFIPPKKRQQAKAGDYLHCRLLQHPFRDGNPQVEVLKVLGNDDTPGIERTYALYKFELVDSWSEEALKEAKALTPACLEKAAPERRDMRETPFVTIDAATTLDMDDALYAEPEGDGWRLWVAIADPTALVAEGGPLEKAARERATTVYFPGEIRPMLPDNVSTQLCSLVAGEDRLALICEIQVGAEGAISDYQLYEAMIHSRGKLSYEQVAAFLDSKVDEALSTLDNATLNGLHHLGELARMLRGWRERHALLNEDRVDYRLRLDDKRKIRCIDRLVATPAHRLVEECMVAANRCAADFLRNRAGHGLFITHGGLRQERVENVRKLLQEQFPALAHFDPATPEGFAGLLREAARLEADLPLRSIVTRQLERAELSTKAAPHQGMGLEAYTTFTSPLRKYLDFCVHRLIRQVLRNGSATPLDGERLSDLQQRQAQARFAANDTEQWLKCQYIQQFRDQDLSGTIVRTLPAGFTVRLDDTGIEGFVTTKDLEGKYAFDPVTLALSNGERRFALDQPVTVKLAEADAQRRSIRFQLVV